MEQTESLDDERWQAVLRRDRTQDGRFVTGVLSTGIYCRPSCAARHPRRENVRFFPDGNAARKAALRPCLRCRPDDRAADAAGIARAIALIERAEAPPTLAEMAAAAGYSPHHFHRLFRRATGLTPAAYARAERASRIERALKESDSITGALYDAGYAAPSRFYADASDRLGMTPSAWRDSGRGMTIRWTIAETALGPLLIAATARGICRVAFEANADHLRRRFCKAVIEPGSAAFADLVQAVAAFVSMPGRWTALPTVVRKTAFQEAIWRELAHIPDGQTLSRAALVAGG